MNFVIRIGTAKFISHNPPKYISGYGMVPRNLFRIIRRNIFRDTDWYREIYFAQPPEMNFVIRIGTAKFISHNPPK
jgi:hypothetical protein